MASARGQADVKRFMAQLPSALAAKVLHGAAKAGADVVAEEARARANSAEVRENVIVKTSAPEGGRVVAKVTVKPGWARSVGIWAEYGTAPHFVTVDESQREGRSLKRINSQLSDAKGDASLVINGAFVGKTVHHPGATPHPFLRPALDTKEAEAVAAAQAYVASRVGRGGIFGSAETEDSE